jgi:hypothetical protein
MSSFQKGKEKNEEGRAIALEVPYKPLQLEGEGLATMGREVEQGLSASFLNLCDKKQ